MSDPTDCSPFHPLTEKPLPSSSNSSEGTCLICSSPLNTNLIKGTYSSSKKLLRLLGLNNIFIEYGEGGFSLCDTASCRELVEGALLIVEDLCSLKDRLGERLLLLGHTLFTTNRRRKRQEDVIVPEPESEEQISGWACRQLKRILIEIGERGDKELFGDGDKGNSGEDLLDKDASSEKAYPAGDNITDNEDDDNLRLVVETRQGRNQGKRVKHGQSTERSKRQRLATQTVNVPSEDDEENLVKEAVDSSPKSCGICDKSFKSINALKAHKRLHKKDGLDKDGRYHCTHCPSIFEDSVTFYQHRRKVHEEPRDFCCICEKQFSRGSLQQHLYVHYKIQNQMPPEALNQIKKQNEISCVICSSPFRSPLLLAAHLEVHKGNYSCEFVNCRKSFYSTTAKRKHMKNVHTNSNDSEVKGCDYCFESYEDLQEMQKHRENHENEIEKKRFLCETCGLYFFTQRSLTQHLRLSHPKKANEPEHVCETCNKSFVTLKSLKVHNKSHKVLAAISTGTGNSSTSMEGLFHCTDPSCRKSFAQKISLQRHMMVHHSGEKRHKCDHCDHPGFTYVRGLRAHLIKMHKEELTTNEKGNNFRVHCDVCFKTFLNEDDLQIHVVGTHAKHKCKICGKQFKMMNHLKEHTLRHTTIRPFTCPHCPSKGYVRENQLYDHLKKVHPNGGPVIQPPFTERITYVIQMP